MAPGPCPGCLCQPETLLAFAEAQGRAQHGDLFAAAWRRATEKAIEEISEALRRLKKYGPWTPDVKASDDFLDPLFADFYERLSLPNLMRKTDCHTLAPFVPKVAVDPEIASVLDAVLETARRARPHEPTP